MSIDSGDSPQGPGDERIRPGPSDDDRAVLSIWKQGATAQDARYANKGLLKIVALAMADPEFRSRLINDAEGVLSHLRSVYQPPEGVYVRFVENTPDTLTVVLPPARDAVSTRSPALRERLRSRTSANAGIFFDDDIDLGDWTDPIPGGGADHGDPGDRDVDIILPPDGDIIA